ncbi:SdiA-regulated domain-containing protein [Pseudomonas seleniipraecipitans]|uniref:SdiA-regulated domain-containing protein n=1 Tax=Phytopseudomonas seleniipraecipitans TaxID=640205 RepID=A0ABY5J388_9GAMM|nr:SdiA-regulated domain-containing protein [Pseudomonas seleniipraecipitans]UUD62496.1 SdiA-regulated domain-containing protein [Pseudomonas seleniipraecipitans]
MRRLLSVKGLFLLLMLVVLAALVITSQQFRLFERAWFNVSQPNDAPSHSLWLNDYKVVIEAQPIEGLEDDVSALTYDPDRQSLFTVTNQHPKLIELSLDGKVLRQIELVGFGDPEAVEYVAPGRFVIADERAQRLVKVRVDNGTTSINAADGQQMSLGLEMGGKNKGFEGLAYDLKGQRLFVAKERDPMRIYEVHGFPNLDPQAPDPLQIRDDRKRDAGIFVRDLSSLHFDSRTGHLLALSDESRLVVELDQEGKPISSLSLLPGQHGLSKSVPQAEGITVDDKGVLYLTSEPNLFYVFSKADQAE